MSQIFDTAPSSYEASVCGGAGWGVREAGWKHGWRHKSEVANITFICTNQETVSVLEKTQANKTLRTWKQM